MFQYTYRTSPSSDCLYHSALFDNLQLAENQRQRMLSAGFYCPNPPREVRKAIKWEKSADGCYVGRINGALQFRLIRNDYGRKFWQVERASGVRVLDISGNDCFSLAIAKNVAEESLIRNGVQP